MVEGAVIGHAPTYDEMNKDILSQNPELPEHSAGVRIGRELLKATEPFAVESVAKSCGQ